MNLKLANNILFTLFVLTAAALIIILLYPPKFNQSVSSQPLASLENSKNAIKATFWNVYPSIVIPNDDQLISDTMTLERNDGKTFLLKELVGKKNKLILRYSSYDCEICVDSVLSKVQLLKGKNAAELLILTDAKTERDFLIKTQNKDHPYNVYLMQNGNLNLTMEGKGFPYLFVLTKDFRATKIFIPFKELSYQTEQYLSYVFKFLNK